MNSYSVYWISHPDYNDYNKQGYIGITKQLDKRLVEHRYKAPNPHFRRAIRCYSWDNLTKKVLANGLDKEGALLIEAMLRPSENIGWNSQAGGGMPPSNKGYHHSKEAKAKIGLGNKGVKRSAETKAKIKAANTNDPRRSGANHIHSKLSPEAVIAIYKLLRTGKPQRRVALLFSIGKTVVGRINLLEGKYYRSTIEQYLRSENGLQI